MKRGFTLVELSIVLVIIGLLIGGILVAESMISTAKTQQLIRLADQYEIAARNFKTAYAYWPGDYPKDDFGCAGNGDGTVGFWTGAASCQMSGYYNFEGTNFFVQLSMANMLSTKLTYLTGGGGEVTSPIPGVNVPAGPDKNSYFRVQHFFADGHGDANVVEMFGDFTADAAAGIGSSYILYNNLCSKLDPAYTDRGPCPALTAIGALAIDQKIDDGFPGTGDFIANNGAYVAGYCGKSNPLSPDNHAQSYAGVPYYSDNKDIICIGGWRLKD